MAALAALSFTALSASPQVAAAQGITCPEGTEVCEKNCMKKGDVCCPGGDFSCPAGQACVGSGKDATCSGDTAGGCPENTEPCTEKELLTALAADGENTARGPVKNWAKQVAAQRCKPIGGTCCTGKNASGDVSAYGCGEGNACGEGEQDNACCPEAGCDAVGQCDKGKKLCGSGCIPETAECCGGTAYCNAGSTCREKQTCTESCTGGKGQCGNLCFDINDQVCCSKGLDARVHEALGGGQWFLHRMRRHHSRVR